MPSIYRIDAGDIITAVNPDWDAFARENEGAHLTGEHVVGRDLWAFIGDFETAQIYRAVLARLRGGAVVPPLPFRCDSPALRRFMELHLRAVTDDGGVELEARLLRSEPREAVALLDPAAPRDDELLRMCSWCKRVAVTESQWCEVEEAAQRLRLFERDRLPELTHAMCDRCFDDLHGADEGDDGD